MIIVWQKLWPELKPYRSRLVVVLLLGVVISATKAMTMPLLQQITEAWTQGDRVQAMRIPIYLVIFWTLSSVARYYHVFWMKYISDLVMVNLRRSLMNKYLSMNLGFVQKFERGAGGLISRMINDMQITQSGVHKISDMLREPFMALFALAYIVYLDWTLVLFVGFTAPVIAVISRRFAKSLRKYGHRNQEAMEDLTKTIKESLDGTRIVQSFNLQTEMRRRFDEQVADFLSTRRKIISREEASGPIAETLASFTVAAILMYIGFRIFAGKLTLPDFMGFIGALTFLSDSIKKLQYGYISLQQGAVALERMQSLMAEENPIAEPAQAQDFDANWERIEFKNVSFAFEEQKVVDAFNLSVRRGEIIALVGESGSGKSTLVNLLERFFDPHRGEIRIGERNIKELRLEDLRRHIALVSQDVFLFADTIRYNIRCGDLSRDPEQVYESARLANADSFIRRLPAGYDTVVGDMGARLSGGEKQRISIARAFFKDAPILILDEATSALDSASEKEVQAGLDSLMQGRTVFVVAHRLATIQKADRILVLSRGRLIEQGSHAELLASKGEYFRFHQLQT